MPHDLTERLLRAAMRRRGLDTLALRVLVHATHLPALALGERLRQYRDSPDPVLQRFAQLQEQALLVSLHQESVEILASRWDKLPERERPHYSPEARFGILRLKTLMALSAEQTAPARSGSLPGPSTAGSRRRTPTRSARPSDPFCDPYPPSAATTTSCVISSRHSPSPASRATARGPGWAQGDLGSEKRASGVRADWSALLRDLKDRGLRCPRLLVVDGHLGIWSAWTQVYPEVQEQQCWNHKVLNVLDRIPRRLLAAAKPLLTKIPYAESRGEAERAKTIFRRWCLAHGCGEAAAVLERGWERMLTFYSFPKQHWLHLRTTNPIESPFAALRLRTDAAKRFKKVPNATAAIWKLLMVAEKTFRASTRRSY